MTIEHSCQQQRTPDKDYAVQTARLVPGRVLENFGHKR
jgi:hypothetical protein